MSGLNGGQTVERCINATYSGSLNGDVSMYFAYDTTAYPSALLVAP